MSEMWNSVAPGWAANAEFVDEHLAAAPDALLDAAGINDGDAVLELAAGPGGAGLRAAQRVGLKGKLGRAGVPEPRYARSRDLSATAGGA